MNADITVDVSEGKLTGATNTMCSFVESKMVRILRLSRLFGCLFISNLSGKTLSNAYVTWKSLYTMYAAVWLWIGFVRRAIYMLSISARSIDASSNFSDYVTLAFRVLVLLKVLINYASLCLGSAKLLDFLQSATAFERATSYVPEGMKKCDVSRALFNFTLRSALWVCFVSSFFAARTTTPGHVSLLKYLPFAGEAVVFCGEVAFFFYDILVYAIVARCSEVLVQYLKYEVAKLQICHSNETSFAVAEEHSPVSTVTKVRANICKIKALKNSLNGLCGPGIVVSTACLLTYSCVNMYRYFILNQSQVHLWLPLVYMAYCAFSLADMAFLSEDLGREVAGAVITFGVILVQTGRDLSHPTDVHESNVSTVIVGQPGSFNFT
ncbi:hypothetical protein HPB50_010230 [Hyalomma asiaticum]|uniref:Uncharacterized protein n=1 Tax=Hyalomma asiaticum TaxID=266040 RepID=A0ACB7RRI0_HYAAI|nr:hypothetical protein HPB50_010230 [Hyalomma asiaticum]